MLLVKRGKPGGRECAGRKSDTQVRHHYEAGDTHQRLTVPQGRLLIGIYFLLGTLSKMTQFLLSILLFQQLKKLESIEIGFVRRTGPAGHIDDQR